MKKLTSNKGSVLQVLLIGIAVVVALGAISSFSSYSARLQKDTEPVAAPIAVAQGGKRSSQSAADGYLPPLAAKKLCDASAKSSVDLPHTVDFDFFRRGYFDGATQQHKLYAAFDYKNRFNGPMRSGYLCVLEGEDSNLKVVQFTLVEAFN